MRSIIAKYGFEIEGEFSPELAEKLRRFGAMHGDGSVNDCSVETDKEGFHKKFPNAENYLEPREFASRVFVYRNKDETEKMKLLFTILKKAYENGEFHWNKSCGFHVHVSFNNSHPPEIMSTEFTDYFAQKMKSYLPDEYEFRKNNHYCKIKKQTAEDIYKASDRYRAVNYCALSKHGTIEFRIFPSNHPEKMFSYLLFVLRIVTQFTARRRLNHKYSFTFTKKKLENMWDIVEKISKNSEKNKRVLEINQSIPIPKGLGVVKIKEQGPKINHLKSLGLIYGWRNPPPAEIGNGSSRDNRKYVLKKFLEDMKEVKRMNKSVKKTVSSDGRISLTRANSTYL